MKTETRWKALVGGVAAVGLILGAVGGFFGAHMTMGDMAGMKNQDMKNQDMKDMRTVPAPPAAVAIPAVTRQLIGVRSAPVAVGVLDQEIRTVGTVGYDERTLTQVNLKVSGWVQDVFVNSIGRPVRRGEPLFTLYSPDLLATQDEYLLALKTKAQLAEDRKSTRLNSSHIQKSRMPSSA